MKMRPDDKRTVRISWRECQGHIYDVQVNEVPTNYSVRIDGRIAVTLEHQDFLAVVGEAMAVREG